MFNLNVTTSETVLEDTGLTQAQLDQVLEVIQLAAEIWGRYIDAPGVNIDLALDFADLSGNTLAQAGANFFSFGGPFLSEVIEELNGRQDSGGALSYGETDANLTIDLPSLFDGTFHYADDLEFDPNPGEFSEIDFLTLIVHELGHSLGFLSITFDPFVENNTFVGANAVAANGGEVALVDGVHFVGPDLLSPTIFNNTRDAVTNVHIGVLNDLGLPIVAASSTSDTLYGYNQFDDTLEGLAGDDVLFGLTGNDVLNGGAGADTLHGGAGADELNGGTAFDTASYEGAVNRVNVSLLSGAASIAHAQGDTFDSIEGLIGSAFGDDLRGANNDNILFGENGNDTLIGFNGDDELFGGEGRDILNGGDGADIIDGGNGADQVRYNGSSVGVDVDLGSGTASGGHAEGDILSNIENLFGSNHGDVLRGDSGNNRIFGHTGDDVLSAGGGIDKLFGGAGADSFVLAPGEGRAFILDFEDDIDQLDVTAYGFDTLADALENLDQVGNHARFRVGDDVLLVFNTDMNDLINDIVFEDGMGAV